MLTVCQLHAFQVSRKEKQDQLQKHFSVKICATLSDKKKKKKHKKHLVSNRFFEVYKWYIQFIYIVGAMQGKEGVRFRHFLFVTKAWNLGQSGAVLIGQTGNCISSLIFNVVKILH